MTKICIRVTSHALDPLPLSQTVTPSRTPSPSSATYFMDGPYAVMKEIQNELFLNTKCLAKYEVSIGVRHSAPNLDNSSV